jgi:hypothetical protein
MITLIRTLGLSITTSIVLLFLATGAPAATVNTQPDGTVNSISGLFIGSNEYVDVEFGALLSPGETTCMIGPGCPAGVYVIALNTFLSSGGYNLVNSASGAGGSLYTVLTPTTRLQYSYQGSVWTFDQTGTLPADADIRFTISAVPLPAAVWLFASALVGLGWARRT